MITIRPNTFETNSSSTHSITITSKSTSVDKQPKPIREGETILLKNLTSHTKSLSNASETYCDTRDLKIAIFGHWIWYNAGDSKHDDVDSVLRTLGTRLGVVFDRGEQKWASFSPYSEYDDDLHSDVKRIIDEVRGNNFTALDAFIVDIIDNDDKVIVDANNDY